MPTTVPRVLVTFALATTLLCDARARADVVEFSPPCAPWQDTVASGHHSGFRCVDRTCRSDAQCSGGHCYNPTRVCVVNDRELGPCTPEGRCAEGTCVTHGRCGS